jgi:type I restriction enzyme M protein
MTEPNSSQSKVLTQKLWGYCKVLRDDGLSYGDYLEQLTYLLFLKMVEERTQPPLSEPSRLPEGYDWQSLVEKSGPELEIHYTLLLNKLAKQPGLLGLIFRKSQNRIQDPAKLRHLVVNLINQEIWSGKDADLAGDFYEDLLERTAAEGKAGAGQYFTPRALIQAMVECVQPQPGQTVADPACGTGGFLLAFYDYVLQNFELDRDQKRSLTNNDIRGNELVDNTARLCAMNLFLHGIGHLAGDDEPPITVSDALASDGDRKVDIVLANPPFGTQSSITVYAESVGDDDEAAEGKRSRSGITIARPDFWATTSNKELNFVQHIRSMLKIGGNAAIVIPDGVLSEGTGANSAGSIIRERLLHECEVHTLLRLPTGIFYKPGVKANVVFFRRHGAAETPATREMWVYDFRTNEHFTLKQKPLRRVNLDDFVASYRPGESPGSREETERFKKYTYEQIAERPGFNIDLWADVSDDRVEDPALLPPPLVIAEELAERLTSALEAAAELSESLAARGVQRDEGRA